MTPTQPTQHHELTQLFASLRTEDKQILRTLYRRDDPSPIEKRRVTIPGIVKLGIWRSPATAHQHLNIMTARGFLRELKTTPVAWAPVQSEVVRDVVVGPAKEVPA